MNELIYCKGFIIHSATHLPPSLFINPHTHKRAGHKDANDNIFHLVEVSMIILVINVAVICILASKA
jgi:hypothetical protein